MSILEISKQLCRDLWMIKKAVENVTKLRTRSKRKGFKNLFTQVERKLKQVFVKQPLWTNAQTFDKAGVSQEEQKTPN